MGGKRLSLLPAPLPPPSPPLSKSASIIFPRRGKIGGGEKEWADKKDGGADNP